MLGLYECVCFKLHCFEYIMNEIYCFLSLGVLFNTNTCVNSATCWFNMLSVKRHDYQIHDSISCNMLTLLLITLVVKKKLTLKSALKRTFAY